MHILASLHGPDAFYHKGTSKEIYLGCMMPSMNYYIDYEVKKEKGYKHGKVICRDYNFDKDCIGSKFENEISRTTASQCSVPTNNDSVPICSNTEDMALAKKLAENITNVGVDDCSNQSCPAKRLLND